MTYLSPNSNTKLATSDMPRVLFNVSGVILYELFVGDRFISLYPSGILSHTPVQFDGCDLLAMRKINAIEFSMSKEEKRYEESLKKLISGFLKTSPDDRLQEREVIKQHSFFKGVDWENLNQLV